MTLQNPSDCVQRRENSLSSAKFVLFSERLVSARIQKHSVWKSMYPFAFEEFLWATGTYEETISNDIHACVKLQRNILRLYRNDITRYAESKEAHKIREIFDLIPSQLDAKNNRFKVSSLSRTARYSNFESDFLWLNEAGITLPCYNCSAPVLPLDLKIKRSQFKLYLCDTGLLCAMYMVNIQFDLLQGDLHLKHDSILQNIFAQELASKNLPLVYYSQKKFGELNFVVQNGRELQIFEIKSGNDFRRHAALSKAIENKEGSMKNRVGSS